VFTELVPSHDRPATHGEQEAWPEREPPEVNELEGQTAHTVAPEALHLLSAPQAVHRDWSLLAEYDPLGQAMQVVVAGVYPLGLSVAGVVRLYLPLPHTRHESLAQSVS